MSSSSVARADADGSGRGALLTGLAAVAVLPVAIYATRFSDAYELLHAAFAIPLAAALGIVAISLAKKAQRRSSLSLRSERPPAAVRAGGILGVLAVCLAASGLVAVGVYGLLEYVGRN